MRVIKFHLMLFLILFLTSFKLLLAVSNKTFFMPRPVLHDAVLQYAMVGYLNNHVETCGDFTINTNVFYQESTESSGLARYFSINNKRELIVKGLGAVDTENKDIAGEWLNIASAQETLEPYPGPNDNYTFSSKFRISPKYKQFGALIHMNKKFMKHFYASGYLPFVQVETNVRLKEYDKQHERNPENVALERLNTIHNAYEAFNNPMMEFGKMSDGWHKLAGLADIKLVLGFNTRVKKDHQVDIYADLLVPTGYKPQGIYVFEPVIGTGGHVGLGFGANLDLRVCKHLNFINRLDYMYLFKATEKRSFDLIANGPWSRYMLATNGKVFDRGIPIINFLTKDLSVTPGSSFNWLSCLHFSRKWIDVEIGYNFYCRESESVHLKRGWNESIGIAYFRYKQLDELAYDQTVIDGRGINSDITGAAGVVVFTPGVNSITSTDLNIKSAENSSSLSNNLYFNVGCKIKWVGNLLNLNLGGNYEFGESNKMLSKWGIWAGLGLYL